MCVPQIEEDRTQTLRRFLSVLDFSIAGCFSSEKQIKISFIPIFQLLSCQGSLRAIKPPLMSKWRQSLLSTSGKDPVLPCDCRTCSPTPSSFTRTLVRCSCNITQVNGILSHTICTEQTCYFFHLTTSALSPSALVISPTPFFFRLWTCYVSKTFCFFALLERYNSSNTSQAKSELSLWEKREDYNFFFIKVFF